MKYSGSCHCKAVTFEIECEPITNAIRCNCSICRRKSSTMSEPWFSPEQMKVAGLDKLTLYKWGDRDMNHWFCTTCGIYPFGEVAEKPGHYRVNLGCIDELDLDSLEIRHIDGASFY